MSDTLVEQPPPPTLPDPALAPPKRPRSPRGIHVVLAVGGALLTIAGAALLFYFMVWRYEATARLHIPSNANVVVRVDLQQVVLFGPVRKHLWPLVLEPAKDASGKPGKPWAERVDQLTGVDVRRDVREVLIASVDATGWIAILGGRIRRGRFVEGFAQLAKEQGWPGWHREGALLLGPGLVVGQADDGTILVGTDSSIVTAALPSSEDGARFALPEDGAVTFALTKEAWSGLSGVLTKLPHGWMLGKIDGAKGHMLLGEKPELTARIQPSAGADPAALANELGTLLAELRLLSILPDFAGEKEALAGATVAVEGGEIVAKALWPLEGLDRGCEQLARALR